MALSDSTTKSEVVAAVAAAFTEKFPEDDPPNTTSEIAIAMGEVIAEVVTPIFDGIRDDAVVEVTDVTAGAGTAPGTIS